MAKIKLNVMQQGFIEQASELTDVNYSEINDTNDLILVIIDLIKLVQQERKSLNEYKEYVNDNYKPIPPSELYGIDERDFH